jgi:hypothetical protein
MVQVGVWRPNDHPSLFGPNTDKLEPHVSLPHMQKILTLNPLNDYPAQKILCWNHVSVPHMALWVIPSRFIQPPEARKLDFNIWRHANKKIRRGSTNEKSISRNRG